MRGSITKRAVLLLAILSAVSLVTLAFLQYRWITELGASERALLDASLERGTRNFREEFNSEIDSIVQRTLAGGEQTPEGLAARFHAASSAIQHPEIAGRIYMILGTQLAEANRSGLESAPLWPAYLNVKREELTEWHDGPPPRPFWNESPPAMALPMMPGGPPRPREGPEPEGPPPPSPSGPGERHGGEGWVIFEFNSAYITSQWIPQLIAKHFGPGYTVEVVSTNNPEHPLLGTPIDHPDAQIGFFNIKLQRPRERRGPPPRRDGPPGGRGRPEAPPFESPRWQLLVKHQSGSLDSQVAAARHRNLGITSAVLLMLGLSSAALVVALNRAEQLNRMQMDFVAGVSHELRTPLAVIRSAGENLADGVVASEKQIKTYGALVRDEGRRLSTMVEQILRFAGLESGLAPYTFVPVSPAEIAARALEDSKAVLENLEVETQFETGLPNIMADEASLSHCLQNLLANAVKYGDGKWVKLQASRRGGEVEFAVSDRGPGIDPSDKPNLFNPFYRGKRAVSDQIRGLGIGLSLVKRIAEAHGGRADVTNLPQSGARFAVYIPLERPVRKN